MNDIEDKVVEPAGLQAKIEEIIENHTMVREIVDLIQLYRRNVLYMSETVFHRSSCSLVQSLMNARSENDQQTQSSVFQDEEFGELLEASKDASWWTKIDPENSLFQVITEQLPDRCFFNHKIFQFADNDRNGIFELLGIIGLTSRFWDPRHFGTWCSVCNWN